MGEERQSIRPRRLVTADGASELALDGDAITGYTIVNAHNTSRIGDLLETADITRFEAYGDPHGAAADVLGQFGADTFKHLVGFTR